MSSILVPQSGLLSDLKDWVAGDLGSAYLRLFQNNHVYAPTDTPAAYTEANFTGYAPITTPAWGVPFINGGGDAEVDSANLVWTFTGSSGTQPVYGIYVTDSAQIKLYLVVPFLTPFIVQASTPTVSQLLQLMASGMP